MTSLATMHSQWQIEQDDNRFNLILIGLVVLFIFIGVIVPRITVPEPTRLEKEQLPPQLAKIILPEKPIEPPKPTPKPEEVVEQKVEEKPQPEPEIIPTPPPSKTVEAAREKAQQSGLLALKDNLASLRENFKMAKAKPLVEADKTEKQLKRDFIADNANKQFAGVQQAQVVQQVGQTDIQDRATTQIVANEIENLSAVDQFANQAKENSASEQTKQSGQRSEAAIRQVLEANKSSLYTLYNRALRKNPLLKGKVVFEIQIEADGTVSNVNIAMSELNDEKLERQLALKLKMLDFGAESVAKVQSKWTIDFLPT